MEEKIGRESPFIGVGQMNPDRQIMYDRKPRVEIKQNNQRWAFKSHFEGLKSTAKIKTTSWGGVARGH